MNIPKVTSVHTKDKKISLPSLWPYRLLGNIFLIVFLIFFSSGIIIIKDNIVGQKLNGLSDYFYQMTTYLGFTLDDVVIYGRDKTSLEDIHNIISSNRGDNILHIDINRIREGIEQLPWVKSVIVSRSYSPNILKIKIKERKVHSIWQINNTFFPIDENGAIIHSEYVPSHPMLLIVGKGAPQHLDELLPVISEDKELYKRIKIANLISERRWNLILDDIENGITVKLPHKDIHKAWKKIIKLNKTQGLLKRKLTIIDLRFDNKVLVKPRKFSGSDRINLHDITESNI